MEIILGGCSDDTSKESEPSQDSLLIIWRKQIAPLGFPGGSDSKASVCHAGDPVSIPGLGRSPGEGNGSPFQYSCLENPMDSRAW